MGQRNYKGVNFTTTVKGTHSRSEWDLVCDNCRTLIMGLDKPLFIRVDEIVAKNRPPCGNERCTNQAHWIAEFDTNRSEGQDNPRSYDNWYTKPLKKQEEQKDGQTKNT